ncbi:hypothetical protein PR048_011818 [Dryococelus australis]|uniref:Uncharacterized protein n=1 Tax=Dryococelus australis TaxID=614101 RepID=A0ABQ9HMV8_9NEOP|nr:hypothetical protein PR048_011818 [Dryococelus australis]
MKDQCILCKSYHESYDEAKEKLEEILTTHNERKGKTREIKDQAKQKIIKLATCVYMFLRKLDELDTKTIALFADSCGGKTRKIVATMLLYVVHNSSSL